MQLIKSSAMLNELRFVFYQHVVQMLDLVKEIVIVSKIHLKNLLEMLLPLKGVKVSDFDMHPLNNSLLLQNQQIRARIILALEKDLSVFHCQPRTSNAYVPTGLLQTKVAPELKDVPQSANSRAMRSIQVNSSYLMV